MQDEKLRSDYFLEKIKQSPQVTRHTLCLCIINAMQTARQNATRSGQDQLDLNLCDLYPEDIYNLYMFLYELEQERA